MALSTFRFEASFPAHPDYLDTLVDLARDVVTYAGCTAAEAEAVVAEIRAAVTDSLKEAAGGGPVVADFARHGTELTLEIAAPRHAGLRIVKTLPAS
jgi:hypothetical protein